MNKRSRNKNHDDDNGFAEWGGYMAAKKAKLAEQYKETACNLAEKLSDIFVGVAIFVNGYTTPSAEELKYLMAAHGGIYHLYLSADTTHIVASNLPNVKIKQLGSVPVLHPKWITDSISAEKLLDYRKYLLYTNQSRKQPTLDFPFLTKKSNVNELEQVKDNSEATSIHLKHNSEPQSHNSKTLTAADPRFLAEFYSNSRLHLISTLGAEYKQLVLQLREKFDGNFPGREKLKESKSTAFVNNEPVIMHIDVDCFFVSVGLRNRPALRGLPVAVTHARSSQGNVNRCETGLEAEFALLKKCFPDDRVEKLDPQASMSEIASCSYEARQCGVRNGMFLGSALKLCPNLQTIPYDFQGYRQVSTILYNTIANYTLDIEAVSCDEMYVDVTPILREAAITVEQWATHIRQEIAAATGCPCSAGFGANRLQARLATKKAKPAGQFHLKPHQVEEYMIRVPLADIPGVGHATLAKLKQLELKTCGDVQMMPLSHLQAELGQKGGETLLEQARGIDRKPLNFKHERKSVSADVNYGIRFKDKTETFNFLRSLSTEVCSRLQDIGMRARCLTLKLLVRAPEAPKETPKFLGCGVCNAINRSTTVGGFISDAGTIYREAKTLYERINVPPTELRGVGIQLTRLERTRPVHNALGRFLQQNCVQKSATKQICSNNEDSGEATNTVTNLENKPTATISIGQRNSPTKKEHGESSRKQSKASTIIKSSKRGRPKRSCSSSKSTKKTVNNLNRYFRSRTTTPSPESNRIDLDVLRELPEDLRNEIIKEYRLANNVTVETSLKNPKENPIDLPVTESKKCSTFDGLNLEELKSVIINWLRSETEPASVDVVMIAEYFKQLAVDRNIETLKKILSFLYRHITKLGLCSWHDAYWTIVDIVQEGMVARYGSTLLVERRFVCSLHF